MSKTSKNKRRSIVVEGATWHWMAGYASTYVWEPVPSTRRHSFSLPVRDSCGWVGDPVTPGLVAQWIRTQCLGLPQPVPATHPVIKGASGQQGALPPVPRTPVPAPAGQLEAYVLSGWTTRQDQPAHRNPVELVMQVHLDPAVAKAQAALLNAEEARLCALACMLDDLVAAIEVSQADHMSANNWWQAREHQRLLVHSEFFNIHNIHQPHEKHRILMGGNISMRYEARAVPLFSSRMA